MLRMDQVYVIKSIGVYHRILTSNQAIQRSFSGCAKSL